VPSGQSAPASDGHEAPKLNLAGYMEALRQMSERSGTSATPASPFDVAPEVAARPDAPGATGPRSPSPEPVDRDAFVVGPPPAPLISAPQEPETPVPATIPAATIIPDLTRTKPDILDRTPASLTPSLDTPTEIADGGLTGVTVPARASSLSVLDPDFDTSVLAGIREGIARLRARSDELERDEAEVEKIRTAAERATRALALEQRDFTSRREQLDAQKSDLLAREEDLKHKDQLTGERESEIDERMVALTNAREQLDREREEHAAIVAERRAGDIARAADLEVYRANRAAEADEIREALADAEQKLLDETGRVADQRAILGRERLAAAEANRIESERIAAARAEAEAAHLAVIDERARVAADRETADADLRAQRERAANERAQLEVQRAADAASLLDQKERIEAAVNDQLDEARRALAEAGRERERAEEAAARADQASELARAAAAALEIRQREHDAAVARLIQQRVAAETATSEAAERRAEIERATEEARLANEAETRKIEELRASVVSLALQSDEDSEAERERNNAQEQELTAMAAALLDRSNSEEARTKAREAALARQEQEANRLRDEAEQRMVEAARAKAEAATAVESATRALAAAAAATREREAEMLAAQAAAGDEPSAQALAAMRDSEAAASAAANIEEAARLAAEQTHLDERAATERLRTEESTKDSVEAKLGILGAASIKLATDRENRSANIEALTDILSLAGSPVAEAVAAAPAPSAGERVLGDTPSALGSLGDDDETEPSSAIDSLIFDLDSDEDDEAPVTPAAEAADDDDFGIDFGALGDAPLAPAREGPPSADDDDLDIDFGALANKPAGRPTSGDGKPLDSDDFDLDLAGLSDEGDRRPVLEPVFSPDLDFSMLPNLNEREIPKVEEKRKGRFKNRAKAEQADAKNNRPPDLVAPKGPRPTLPRRRNSAATLPVATPSAPRFEYPAARPAQVPLGPSVRDALPAYVIPAPGGLPVYDPAAAAPSSPAFPTYREPKSERVSNRMPDAPAPAMMTPDQRPGEAGDPFAQVVEEPGSQLPIIIMLVVIIAVFAVVIVFFGSVLGDLAHSFIGDPGGTFQRIVSAILGQRR
jgi:hypothetical protein